MAPSSDSESVSAKAQNHSQSNDNNSNRRGKISSMSSAEPNRYASKAQNSPCSSPVKQPKQTANHAIKQVRGNSYCNDIEGKKEEGEEEEEEERDENDGDKDRTGTGTGSEIEQSKQVSSDAKTLKAKAKRISRCLSSNETRASQQQHEKLKVVPQDKGSTDLKAKKKDPQNISPSSSTGNTANQSLVEPTQASNLAKNISASRVSAAQASSSQQANIANSSKLKATDINGVGTANQATSIATNNRSGSQHQNQNQHQQQQRQMFSLKQLAINPRSLTKKRCSLQTGASSSIHDNQLQPNRTVFPKLFDCSQNVNHSLSQASSNECQEQTVSSSSGSSTELSATNADKFLQVKRRNSNRQQEQLKTTGDQSVIADEVQLDELEGNKENSSSFLGESNGLSDEHFSDEDDDEDEDEDDEDEDVDDDINEDDDSDSELDNDITGSASDEDSKTRQDGGSNGSQIANGKRNGRRKRRSKKRQNLFRRSSCCNCEQLISKIDCDGLPVTDVDLVSYKDLCQMEQQAHHMRRTGHQGRQQLDTPACASTLSRANYGWQSGGSIRRSSLQEESGAYYELCTSGDEQLIRQNYAWFPPSLKQLHLVDKFFENFSKDKIPYASQGQLQNLSGTFTNKQDQVTNHHHHHHQQQQQQQQQQLPEVKVGGPNKQQTGLPSSLAASSYRDEQISSQLPRQDISLDYCSYPMSDSSRAAYMQFVDKRNSQALDVGNVVQVKLNSFSQKSTIGQQAHSNTSSSGWQTSPSEDKQFQRRVSAVSQSGVALMSLNQVGHHEQMVGQHGSIGSGAQRCRRCLVRFDDKQLAVMAPNFVIGSTSIYRSSVIPSTSVLIEGQATAVTTATPPSTSTLTSTSTSTTATTTPTTPVSGTVQAKLRDKQTFERDRSSSAASTTNVALYHPNCFTCSTCKEFLVDLVYCLRDNKLYCLRHYGESLRPRCSWCQELIFSDEYLKAMNESFHVDHFLCRHCDTNLAGQRYVLKEEKPFCIQCYEGNFANICEDCQKPIGIDSRDLSYKDRHWHDTCFLCNKCQQSLIDKPFGSKIDKVYCADCYDNTFATRCDGCKNPFRAGSKKMEYRGKQWHDSCFCCCVCQNTIGSNSFIPKNEEIYCIKCYEDKFATKCIKCKQVIASGGVTFRNEPWHRDCFNCCNCNKSLAGQRFTTRDVKNETVKNTNKTNQPHNAYCIDCYGELFAKKCFACTQAITGLGGTRFVTFEDRSWHNDCFLCNDCNTSLVGKGFITDGPETILCSECARAKLR